jgi:acyl carrier protein
MTAMKSMALRAETETADLEIEIQRIFGEQLGLEVPAAETDLFASGTLDSLVLVRLLVALEERLGARIALDSLEMSDFRSIARIAGFLARDGVGPGGGPRP